jgi:hypothetical protein
MLVAVRKNGVVLTLLSLTAIVTFAAGSIAVLSSAMAPAGRANPGGALGPADGGRVLDDALAAAAVIVAVSVGWWVFAKATGALWRMNEGASWKFLMCTGALGLVLSALFYDFVVILIVRRLYVGEGTIRTCILAT